MFVLLFSFFCFRVVIRWCYCVIYSTSLPFYLFFLFFFLFPFSLRFRVLLLLLHVYLYRWVSLSSLQLLFTLLLIFIILFHLLLLNFLPILLPFLLLPLLIQLTMIQLLFLLLFVRHLCKVSSSFISFRSSEPWSLEAVYLPFPEARLQQVSMIWFVDSIRPPLPGLIFPIFLAAKWIANVPSSFAYRWRLRGMQEGCCGAQLSFLRDAPKWKTAERRSPSIFICISMWRDNVVASGLLTDLYVSWSFRFSCRS